MKINHELRHYLLGFGLSVVLTALPFLLVWNQAERATTIATLVTAGVLQLGVHLRFFLHLRFRGQQREDLQLVLFTFLILLFMIGGTVWIYGSLAGRM